MPEHDERECIRTRRDAAAAIGDDFLVERTDGIEAPAQLVGWQKSPGSGIDQMRRRQINAARDAAEPAIAVAAAACMLLGRQRVERADRAITEGPAHLVLPDHQVALLAHDELRCAARACRPGLDWPTLAAPFLKAAIQHRGIVKAEDPQQPPYPC